jgi:hypothetical protein
LEPRYSSVVLSLDAFDVPGVASEIREARWRNQFAETAQANQLVQLVELMANPAVFIFIGATSIGKNTGLLVVPRWVAARRTASCNRGDLHRARDVFRNRRAQERTWFEPRNRLTTD